MKRLINLMFLLGMLIVPTVTAQPKQEILNVLPSLPDATHFGMDNDPFPVGKNGRVNLIIELKGEPIGAQSQTSKRAATLVKQQQTTASALQSIAPSIVIRQQYQTLFNGMSVAVDAEDVAAVSTLPNVKAIHNDTHLVPLVDSTLDLIDADFMWSAVDGQTNAGSGVKIAIIDSGIDPDHPMFNDDNYTMPAGYPKGYCAISVGFCNNKVIAARWYGDEDNNIPKGASNTETKTPFDFIGTGTHVAGIAAGNANTIATIDDDIEHTLSGVAPRAYIMAYKICWLSADCLASNAIKAVEDAVADGADVINISLGSGAGNTPLSTATAPFAIAIQNAIKDGVPVVVPAGDEGDTAGSIICPGCVKEAITVGSSSTDHIYALPISVTGVNTISDELKNIPAVSGDKIIITEDINGILMDAADVNNNNRDGCTVFPAGSLFEMIVLLERGNCTFNQKLTNAQIAGAKAAIVFDNTSGELVTPDVGNATLPMVLIPQTDGEALRQHIDNSATVTSAVTTINIGHQPISMIRDQWSNWVLSSSSRGPNGDMSYLKPDLVAPGKAIIVADIESDYQIRTGSGLAAPFVTGALALLHQLHPTWTPHQMKSAVMAQANINNLMIDDGVTLGNPFDRGAGRLDLDRLTNNPALFDHPSWIDSQCTNSCSWETVLTNITDKTLTYSSAIKNSTGMTWSVSPGVVQLTAGQSQTVTVTVDVNNKTGSEWLFADLVWTASDSRFSESSLPMAIYVLGDDFSTFEKTVSPTVAGSGEAVRWTFTIRNKGNVTRTATIKDVLPAGLRFDPGSLTPPFNYIDNTLTADFVVKPQFSFTRDSFRPYQSLTAVDPNLKPVVCPDKCDDEYIVQTGLSFTYLGKTYDTIYINTNGYITLSKPEGTLNLPQQLPSETAPNGIIAPLWSDYDLQGDANDVTGGGNIYVMSVATASNPDGWVVIEWKDAQHWVNPNDTNPVQMTASFQVWIETNGDRIWFSYGTLTNEDAYRTSVGVESEDGKEGTMHWLTDGRTEIGTSPLSNEMVRFESNVYEMSFETIVEAPRDTRIINIATMETDGKTLTASEMLTITQSIPTMIVLSNAPTAVVTQLTLVLFVLALAIVTLVVCAIKFMRDS